MALSPYADLVTDYPAIGQVLFDDHPESMAGVLTRGIEVDHDLIAPHDMPLKDLCEFRLPADDAVGHPALHVVQTPLLPAWADTT